MAHLFEVLRVSSRTPHACRWRIRSEDMIDTDIYIIINQKIKAFQLVAADSRASEIFVYEIEFHRSQERSTLQRMFPHCLLEPIVQRSHSRILVYYDAEDNCYRPYDDSSM